MTDPNSGELIKRVVGKRKQVDVWDELYRLNMFAANLGLLRAVSDGYSPKKVVGRLHPTRR